MFGKRRNKDKSKNEANAVGAALEKMGLDPNLDGLDSPLKGKSIPAAVVIIAVAIAIPGGVYVLLFLIAAPLVAQALLKNAKKAAGKGEDRSALDLATAAVRASRKSPRALSERALIHFQLGDTDSAVADADAAIRKNEKTPLAQYVRGAALQQAGQLADALDAYEAFLLHAGPDEAELVRDVMTRLEHLDPLIEEPR